MQRLALNFRKICNNTFEEFTPKVVINKDEIIDTLKSQLADTQKELVVENGRACSWCKAVRELAMECGMLEDEDRTTRYLGYIRGELYRGTKQLAELREAAQNLVDKHDHLEDYSEEHEALGKLLEASDATDLR